MNEQQLIRLVQDGESDAYRSLVERYQVGLIIYCNRFVQDRDVAEDIAQEAFIKAFYSIGEFDSTRAAFSTWVYRIANNTAKDYLRKARVTTPLPDYDIPSESATLSESEANEIRHAVSQLEPPEYAHAIRAYYWEGKRYDTIAKELNVPAATIGTWIRRAKVKLRKELA